MSTCVLAEECSDYSGSSFQAILAPELPPWDERGWSTGMRYKPFITARHGRKGVASTLPGTKCARPHEYLSLLERRLHYMLELDRDVVDIREQYPFYDYQKMQALLTKYKRIPRNAVATLDVLVTFRVGPRQLGYRGLSVKPKKQLTQPGVWRRLLRERQFCIDMGWEWRLVTDEDLKGNWWKSCRRVCEYIVHSNAQNHQVAATTLARLVVAQSAKFSTLDGLLDSVRCNLHCSSPRAYRLFAIASVLGKFAFNQDGEIFPTKPLILYR